MGRLKEVKYKQLLADPILPSGELMAEILAIPLV